MRGTLCVALAITAIGSGCAEPGATVTSARQAVTVCSGDSTVAGVDVSKWQGTIDWSKVRASGVEFAFIRVSDGATNLDGMFSDNWAGAKSAGVLRGAYQFFRPGSDPAAQAEVFLEALGGNPGDLPPVLDIEVTDGESASTVVSRAQTWLDLVEGELGVRPVIYTAKGFWNQLGNPAQLVDYSLWLAQWGPTCPDVPDPWTDWQFFQTSASGSVPGISGDVDIDVFNGDRNTLEALVLGSAAGECGVLDTTGGILDDDDPCFVAGGKSQYMRTENAGHGGTLRWTYVTDFAAPSNYGLWKVQLESAGDYRVEVSTPAPHAQSHIASYQVSHDGVQESVVIDQAAEDGWRDLGAFHFAAGGNQWIRLDDNTGEAYDQSTRLAFDAVRLTPVGDGTGGGELQSKPGAAPDDAPEVQPVAGGCRAGGGAGGFAWLVLGALAWLSWPVSERRRLRAARRRR